MARIGERNKYLTFQAPTKDANGVTGWQTIFSCYGSYWPLTGQESIVAQQVQSPITGKIRIAYRPVNILTTWRIKYKEKYLNIAALPINLGGRNMELEIKVREA